MQPPRSDASAAQPASQDWDPERYSRTARFVSDLGVPVVELLAPKPGERILDLGCGDGALTKKLAAFGADVVGVDASGPQIEAARKLGLDVRVMDAAQLDFEGAFDAVFTNAALHWVKDADAVIRGVWRALKPGGRFVGEFGGAGNVEALRLALIDALDRRGIDGKAIDPWFFPTVDDYRARLEGQGFAVQSIALIPRPTPLPTGIEDWLANFADSFLRRVPENERVDVLAEIVARVRPVLCDAQGRWTADYVRLRFAASKPGR